MLWSCMGVSVMVLPPLLQYHAISISCWYVGSVKNWKPTLHRNPTVGHVVSSHLTYPSHLRSWCSSTSMRPRTRPPRNHWYPKDWRVHLFVIILHMNMWQFGVISGQTHVGTGQDFKTPNMFLWHTNWLANCAGPLIPMPVQRGELAIGKSCKPLSCSKVVTSLFQKRDGMVTMISMVRSDSPRSTDRTFINFIA